LIPQTIQYLAVTAQLVAGKSSDSSSSAVVDAAESYSIGRPNQPPRLARHNASSTRPIYSTPHMNDALLSLEDAAKLLDYSTSGLRKIVNRTKAGGPGPKIKYFQVGSGPIKFRKAWIDAFIEANTVAPITIERSPSRKQAVKRHEPSGPNHGFDPAIFRRPA
jgi:hypothetical protein